MSNSMNIVPPTASVTQGPEWANDLNNILTDQVAEHDHTLGKGVQITPSGLNINDDLDIDSNNLTNVRTTRFAILTSSLTAIADANCVYDVNGDLYFNDGNRVAIPITENGGIAVTSFGGITGLSGTTGRAIYSAGSFQWEKNPSPSVEFAYMEQGPTKIFSGNDTNPTYGTTISSIDSASADSTLVLPTVDVQLPTTLPSSKSFLTMTVSGAVEADVSTDAGITYSMLSGNIPSSKLQTIAYSASFDGHSVTGSSFNTAVTINSVPLNGRPILVTIQGSPNDDITFPEMTATGGTSANLVFFKTTFAGASVPGSPASRNCGVNVIGSGTTSGPSYYGVVYDMPSGSTNISLETAAESGVTASFSQCIFTVTQL